MTCPNCGGENLTDYPVCRACAPKCHAIGRIEIGLNCIHCDIQMAAFPLMLEALEAAFTYVLNYALYDDDYRANIDLQCPEHEEKLAKQLKAALEAAKGE